MGMYDWVRCDYPLPVETEETGDFQTKDTPAQMLDLYEIREDGSFWHQAYGIEDQSDPNAKGLASIYGAMARVNERWEPMDKFTGEVAFYRFYDESEGTGWVEFSACFKNGQLSELNTITNCVD